MPADPDEDWEAAVRAPTTARLRDLIESTSQKPTANKIMDAFVSACAADAADALVLLLEWGVSPDAKDLSGRLALHAAAESGAARACAILGKHGADLERPDAKGLSAMMLAIGRNKLKAVKSLLHAGAVVPENASAPGLAAVIKEVATEKHIAELKRVVAETVVVKHEDLVEADKGVWLAQREHMRLLKLREEQRAGMALDEHQKRTKLELAAAERYKAEEAENQKVIAQQRVEVLEKKTRISQLTKEFNYLYEVEMKAKAEDDKLKAELRVRHDEIAELTAACIPHEAAEKQYWAELAEAQEQYAQAKADLQAQKVSREKMREAMLEAREEFEALKKERVHAAELARRAHTLMGN